MKAIETVYNGYRFRSRLEARWAVFFDHLGVQYRYEPEGYILRGIRYLPDFWLPDQDCWFEVKGKAPSHHESSKAEQLCEATKNNVYVAYGDCWYPGDAWPPPWAEPDGPIEKWDWFTWADEDGTTHQGVTWDNFHAWCICPSCGRPGIQFEGRGARICRHDDDDRGHTYDHPRLIAAFTAARQARFEFRGGRGG